MYGRADDLYLPKTYGNSNNLEGVFRGIAEIDFVDPAYLNRSLSRLGESGKTAVVAPKYRREQANAWRTFFTKLGVETVLRVSPAPGQPENVHSPDLAKVIGTGDPEQIRTMLQLLDANWSRYRRHLEFETSNAAKATVLARQDPHDLLHFDSWLGLDTHTEPRALQAVQGVPLRRREQGHARRPRAVPVRGPA